MRARTNVPPFEFDIVETPRRLRWRSRRPDILEFVGKNRIDEIVCGTCSEEEEAIRVLEGAGETTGERILGPLLVDWHSGRAYGFTSPLLSAGRKEGRARYCIN